MQDLQTQRREAMLSGHAHHLAASESEEPNLMYPRQLHPAAAASATVHRVLHGAEKAAYEVLCRQTALPHIQQHGPEVVMMHVQDYLHSARPLEGTHKRVLGAGSEGLAMQVSFQLPTVEQQLPSPTPVRPDIARKFACYTADDVLVKEIYSFGEVGLGALCALGVLPQEDGRTYGAACPRNVQIWPTSDCKQEMLRVTADCGPGVLRDDVWAKLDGAPGVMIVLDFELLGLDLEMHVTTVEHCLEHPGVLGHQVSPLLARRLLHTPLGAHVVNVYHLWQLIAQSACSVDDLVQKLYQLHGDLKPTNFLTVPSSQGYSKHGEDCYGVQVADLSSITTQAQPFGSDYVFSRDARMGTPGYMGNRRLAALTRNDATLLQEDEVAAFTGTAVYTLLGCSDHQADSLMRNFAFWLLALPDQTLAQQLVANNTALQNLGISMITEAEAWWGLLQQIAQQGLAGQAFMAILGVIAEAHLLSSFSINSQPPLFTTSRLVKLLMDLSVTHIRHLANADDRYVVMLHSRHGILHAHQNNVMCLLDEALRQPHLLKALCRFHPDTLEWLQQDVPAHLWEPLLKPKLRRRLQRRLEQWREQQPAVSLLSHQQQQAAAVAAGAQAAVQVTPIRQQDDTEKGDMAHSSVGTAGLMTITATSGAQADTIPAAGTIAASTTAGTANNYKKMGRSMSSLEVQTTRDHTHSFRTQAILQRGVAGAPNGPAVNMDRPAKTVDSHTSSLKHSLDPATAPIINALGVMPAAEHQFSQARAQDVACTGGLRLPRLKGPQARSCRTIRSHRQFVQPAAHRRARSSPGAAPASVSVAFSTQQWTCSDRPVLGELSTLLIADGLEAGPVQDLSCNMNIEQAATPGSSMNGAVTDDDSQGGSNSTLSSCQSTAPSSPGSGLTEGSSIASDAEDKPVGPGLLLDSPAKTKKGLCRLLQWRGRSSGSATAAKERPTDAPCTSAPKKAGLLSKLHRKSSDDTTAEQQQPLLSSLDCSTGGHDSLGGGSNTLGSGKLLKPGRLFKCWSKGSNQPVQDQLWETASTEHSCPTQQGICSKVKHEAQRAGLGFTEMCSHVRDFKSQASAEVNQGVQQVVTGFADMRYKVEHFLSQAPREIKNLLVCGAPSHC